MAMRIDFDGTGLTGVFSSPDTDRTAVIRVRDHGDRERNVPPSYHLWLSDGTVAAGEFSVWWAERRACNWIANGTH